MDFALVAALVMALVLALLQLAFTLHTRSIITCAAEDAVRVAAAFGGDTGAGERRFRELAGRDVSPSAIESLQWVSTLDTLTLRVRSRLPLVGPLGPSLMTTTASAFHEEWP